MVLADGMSVTCEIVVLETKNPTPLSAASYFGYTKVDDTSTSHGCHMRDRFALNRESAILSMVLWPFCYNEVDDMSMWITEKLFTTDPIPQPRNQPLELFLGVQHNAGIHQLLAMVSSVARQYWWPDNEA